MDFSKLPAILTPDLGLLFWMLLAFAVVFFVLAKYGFPAIVGMVEERNKYIEDSLKKAHEASERLENIKQEGEAILQEARDRQSQILKEAAETRDAIVEQAQDGQQVGGSFASSCLSNSQQVVSVEYLRNTFFLDWCTCLETHVVERIENIIIEIEFVEIHIK